MASEVTSLVERNEGHFEKSVESLKGTEYFDFGTALDYLPIFLRGRCALDSRNAEAATGEFQKILRHRGVSPTSPVYSLASLGLARALALEGKPLEARTKYQDFFMLWKNADPDIPILKEAKAEYAKLQ
jgi:hypothetical protein